MGTSSDPNVPPGKAGRRQLILPRATRPPATSRGRGFTILELLVATVVFIIIVGVVLNFTDQTSKIWRGATAKIQAFQEARAGFDSMTRNLAQAMLNTYYDYYDAGNVPRASLTTSAQLANFVPDKYDRMSDLHFISGQAQTLLAESVPKIITQTQAVFFQAPKGYTVAYEGLDNALNATGYFLQFDDGGSMVPDFIKNSPSYKPRWRFRMMEMTQSSEELKVYANSGSNDWFVKNAASSSRVIAENVIALVLLPKLPERQDSSGTALAPRYNFNSRIGLGKSSDPDWADFPGDSFVASSSGGGNATLTRHHQLPPIMRAVMIVLDEASASRLQGDGTTVPAAIDFRSTDLFTDAAKLDEDIQKVEDICNAIPGNLTGNTMKLSYRVFSTDIIMRQAKWSNK